MTATATAAHKTGAPNAAATREKGFWLHLTQEDFDAYVKSAKINKTRADEMRARRTLGMKPAPAQAPLAAVMGLKPYPDAHDLAGNKELPAGKPPTKAAATRALQDQAPKAALRTRFISPDLIDRREGWNPRFDFGEMDILAQSIKSQKKMDGHGLLNDIRVKEKADGRYELVDGDRRLSAVEHLMEHGEVWDFGIPAKVEPADATDLELLIKMFEANAGKPFLPVEEAFAFKRMKDAGMNLAQIEEKTGRSDNSINGALALLENEDLVEAVSSGAVNATLGKEIAVHARGDKQKQKELVEKAKAAKKSGSKEAMREVKRDIETTRRAKIAKQFPKLQLKARMLDVGQIDALGLATGNRLKELMEKMGMAHDSNLQEWVSNDRELQIAANFGALLALRNVMGDATVKAEF